MGTKRRGYGEGSVYQRASDGRWCATIEAGFTASGARRRLVVTAKTRTEALKKRDRKSREVEQYGDSGWDPRTTVKQWIETYLEQRKQPPKPLSPKAHAAASTVLLKWVVPAIGHRRVAALTPGDVRKVMAAQFASGAKVGGVDVTYRNLMTCLRRAKADGAPVAESVFLTEKPGSGENDRMPLSAPETLACLAVAADLPHGIRWLLALLYGARQAEILGLVERDPLTGEPCIDFENHEIHLRWQLQPLKYRVANDRSSGFDIPQGYVAVHLSGRFHLTRPKSKAGHRVLPMPPEVESAIRAWLDKRPDNPWGLVFPAATGQPRYHDDDRDEWKAIQEAAGVAHPSGRPYHIHECRNFAATQLDETDASDLVITSLLGHTSIVTTRRYQRANAGPKMAAVESALAKMLGKS